MRARPRHTIALPRRAGRGAPCASPDQVQQAIRDPAGADALTGRIALEYLPTYASELNPVEYIWKYLKHHSMPNFCARDLGDLKYRVSRHLRSMQRRATLVTAFWRQASRSAIVM